MDHSLKPFVIGICGGTCSGKTTICDLIGSSFEDDVTTIKTDSYYKGGNSKTNFDHPNSIDWDILKDDLKKLIAGHDVDIPVYDFATHCRKKETQRLKPKRIILVEGILIFWQEELRNLFDLRVFVEAGSVVRFQRRLDRDIKERGRLPDEVTYRWNKFVGPCHHCFVEPTSKFAHITLHNNEPNSFEKPPQVIQIDIIMTYIEKKLATSVEEIPVLSY